MANNRWSDFKGGLANMLASGKVYNKYTNTYAPQNVTGMRIASGVAGQFGGPVGTIAGLVGGQASKYMDGAQSFDRRLETSPAIAASRDQLRQDLNGQYPGVQVNDIGDAPMSGGLQTGGSLAGMVSPRQGPSNFGPYQGGYQFGTPAPTTSGLPNTPTSYGVSLPNYGGQMQAPMQGPQLTPEQLAEQARIDKNNSYGSPSMFATGGVRQTGGDSNLMNTGGTYFK